MDKTQQHQHASMCSLLYAIGSLVALCFIESFSYGIVSPLLPIATTEYFATTYANATTLIDCAHDPQNDACIYGSKQANWWSSVFSGAGSVCLIFLSPIFGQASDCYGRKPFLVVFQLLRVPFPWTIWYFMHWNGSIWPFYAMNFVSTALGSMGVSSASIADVVRPVDRAAAFGILYATFAVGFCLSAALCPFFSEVHVLSISCALYALRLLWSVGMLRETLSNRQRASTTLVEWENPIQGMAILCRTQLFLRLSLLIALTTFVANGVHQIRWYFLNTAVRFDQHDTAHMMLCFGIGSILAQALLLKPLMHCAKEKGVILIALVARILECAGYVTCAFLPSKAVVFATSVPSSVGDLSFVAIASLKSVNCATHEQGRLQGAIYGMRAFFEATGPVVYAALYASTTDEWTGAMPFLLSMILYVLGMIVTLYLPVTQHHPHHDFSTEEEEEEEEDEEEEAMAKALAVPLLRGSSSLEDVNV